MCHWDFGLPHLTFWSLNTSYDILHPFKMSYCNIWYTLFFLLSPILCWCFVKKFTSFLRFSLVAFSELTVWITRSDSVICPLLLRSCLHTVPSAWTTLNIWWRSCYHSSNGSQGVIFADRSSQYKHITHVAHNSDTLTFNSISLIVNSIMYIQWLHLHKIILLSARNHSASEENVPCLSIIPCLGLSTSQDFLYLNSLSIS